MEALPTPALLKHVLLSEILVVTSVMRKNSRWASSTLVMAVRDTPALGTNMGLRISSPAYHTRLPGRGTREVELMAGFIELKRAVKDMEGGVVLISTTSFSYRQIFNVYRYTASRSYRPPCSLFCDSSVTFIDWTYHLVSTFCTTQLLRLWSIFARLAIHRCCFE
jgi:hypothetical protein